MNNKNKTWFAMIIIGYIVVLMVYVVNVIAQNGTPAVAENNTHVAAENPSAATEYVECGSCGAHVYEYWYVENINDGTPVEVCRYCYENYIANTATEN